MKLTFFPLALTGLLGFSLIATGTTTLADTVDLTAQGTFTQPGPFSVGGLTITGSADLSFTAGSGAGFGIVGGSFGSSDLIDGNESALFHFDAGPATGVSFNSFEGVSNGGDTNIGIEGFDAGGVSLGVVPVFFAVPVIGNLDVSSLFGNVPLSAFDIQGGLPDTGVNVATINFTPFSAVPEPGTYALIGSLGLTGAAFLRRRRAR